MADYNSSRPLQRFFKLLELDKKDITYIYIYAILAGLITLSLPLGIQAVIGLIAGGAISTSLIVLVAIVTLGTTLSGVLKVMQLTVTETIQRRIFARSAFDFAYRIPRIKLDEVVRFYPPELVNRFFDTLSVQKGLPKILIDTSTAVLQILFGLILISFYHPFFVFFGLALVFIMFWVFRLTGPGGLKTSLKESKYKYEVAYWLEEVARAMNTFKLSGGTSFSLNKTDGLVCNYLDARKDHFKVLVNQYSAIVAFKAVITAALLFLGAYLVIQNQINIGQFVAAEIVVILVLNSVEKLILTMDTIYDVLTGLEKLGAVVDLPIEGEEGTRFEQIDTGTGIEVTLENLQFRFADATKNTLDNLSLSIKPNERICIAGYNGSGKSTLLQIMAGLYTDFRGAISFNGYPMQNLNIHTLRQQIGDYSAQEDIFRGTILENITFSCPDVPMKEVVRISKQIGLSPYIDRLPDGYGTMLLPEGSNVPQSVRTRIILARCIISKPRMLAVEGFFYGIEQQDREMISDFLTSQEHNWTMITVTDDPVLASRCDRIIIMKDGKIVEQGDFKSVAQGMHFKQVFTCVNSVISENGQLKQSTASQSGS
ncbi:peptidase domain-containing ABC transporter [Phaeodactylibacter luteus]|uniref:ATP-binding cassette domain-containing protein n=1 Tax=Phaeodactylibacter luteus TaxID=1564516 RepID=A0A5C6RT46_9BACT|nr:ATP-binding cassette domain-containing protein [Phaeodactylibacter luteus]TXB64492.1 ATP-binding cassette domain-containing protein [Phaeodactylibacter luteus]